MYPALFSLLGPSAEVQALGSSYGAIRLYGSGPFLMYLAVVFFFRGVRMVLTPMLASILMNLVNFNLDCVLIPRMGVDGASWASNAGILAAMVFMALAFFSPSVHRRFGTRTNFRPDPALMLRMCKVGVPAGLQFFIDVASFTVFASFIGRMGDVSLAASQVALQIESLGFNVCWGFTVATTTLVGQYVGAGRPDLARTTVRSSSRMLGAYLFTLLIVIGLWPAEMLSIFTDDREVIALGVGVLYLAMAFMFFDGMGVVAAGALRGAGDTRAPMVISLVASWGFFLPLAYVFGKVLGGGVIGAWTGAAIYIVAVAGVFMFRWHSGVWEKMKI